MARKSCGVQSEAGAEKVNYRRATIELSDREEEVLLGRDEPWSEIRGSVDASWCRLCSMMMMMIEDRGWSAQVGPNPRRRVSSPVRPVDRLWKPLEHQVEVHFVGSGLGRLVVVVTELDDVGVRDGAHDL
jgi:hypothetical protein